MSKPVLTKFPFISLTKALERARSLYNSDMGNKGMSVPIAFAAWDYSEKSSGGFQTISALKQYGLVRDEGANDDRRVKLTDQARRYFASEISNDKEKFETEFAMFPAVMKHLAEHWNYGCPPDNVARTYLKNDLGLGEQSARSLLGIYKENQRYVGLGDNGSAAESNESYSTDENTQDRQIIPTEPTLGGFAPKSVMFTGSNANPEETDRDIFSVSEGEVVLVSPKSLSAESLEDISDWLDIMKRKLARKTPN